MATRFGALDLGTNTVLLTIAELVDDRLVVVRDEATITRLGRGVDRNGRLDPDARVRTLACLARYRALLDRDGVQALRAVGTSALRDAADGADFVREAESLLGARFEVVSGDREAELTFRGAASELPASGPLFVFDIGGGSTELIRGVKDESGTLAIGSRTSLDLGSVRLFERFASADPPSARELGELESHVFSALAAIEPPSHEETRTTIGVAGTVTTIAALATSSRPNDDDTSLVISTAEARRVRDRLAALSLHEREHTPGLDPGRADVIVCGATLLVCLLEWAGVDNVRASDRGVRFGLLEEAFAASRKVEAG